MAAKAVQSFSTLKIQALMVIIILSINKQLMKFLAKKFIIHELLYFIC